jgi:glycosyltransferase (activator-dependent family)
MRVLFATIPEKSHLYCMVPIGMALVAAGHEVRVASARSFGDVITQTGLTAVPVGEDYAGEALLRENRGIQEMEYTNWNEINPDKVTWEKELLRNQMFVLGMSFYNDTIIDGLVEYCLSWQPDLVIWDAMTYSAGIAAHASGAAHARIMSFADVWTAKRNLFLQLREKAPTEEWEDPIAGWLTERASLHGCEFSEDLLTGQWTIDPLQVDLGLTSNVRRVPVRYVPYNGPAVVDEWLREPPTRPRICVTLGNSNTERYGGDFVSKSDILEALSDLDVEVIATFLPVQQESLETVPSNVRIVNQVALHLLLPSCSAVIHHGGFGTYSTALVCGVPQLFVSMPISDHLFRGKGLVEQGAGLLVLHHDVTAQGVRNKVSQLLDDPSFRENSHRLRAEALAQPTPHDVVPVLQELVTQYRNDGTAIPDSTSN